MFSSLYQRILLLRTYTLSWVAGVSSALNGIMMLITPHHYYLAGFRLVHENLPFIGYIFLGIGSLLLFTISINRVRWRTALAHLGVAMLYGFVATSFAMAGQWSGFTIFLTFSICVLGVGFISDKQLSLVGKQGLDLREEERPSSKGDLFVTLLGLCAVCQGGFLFLSNLQSYSLFGMAQVVFGMLYVVGGSLLIWAQLSSRMESKRFLRIHFSLWILFIVYLLFNWLNSSVNSFMFFNVISGCIMCLLPWLGWVIDRREPNSLRARLGLIFSSAAILPLAVVIGLLSDRMEHLTLEEAKLSQRMQSIQYTQQIEKNTHKRFDRFVHMTHQIATSGSDTLVQRQIFLNFGNEESYLSECAVYDDGGKETYAITFQQGAKPYHQTMFEQLRRNYDSELVQFRFMPQTPERKGHIVLAAAMEDSFAFRGTVACSFNQQFLESMVRNIQPDSSQQVSLLNEEGLEVIAYREGQFLFYPETITNTLNLSFLQPDDGRIEIHGGSEEKMITVYKDLPLLQWHVVTQYPADKTLTQIHKLRQTMLWVLLLLACIAMIGGMWLATYLTKPLHMLIYAVGQFGHGTKDAPLPLGGVAEITHLSDAFASMRSQLIKTAEEREQAIQIRDLFFSVAAHELKTPLTSLIGQAELLQRRARRDTSLAERYAQSVNVIVAQAFRLNRMIIALLDISRLQHGKLTLDNEQLNLQELVLQVVEEVRPTLMKHTIVYCADAEVLNVYGDILRLEQVIQNLINNAVKYSPNGGTIYVSLEHQSDSLEIRVKDEGIGIAEKDLPYLFERFFRAHTNQYSTIFGMGIGLYVVKEIIGLHGGSIEVESREGEGSTFIVRLPFVQAPVEELQALTVN
jgi:signal transduction histidine kinase